MQRQMRDENEPTGVTTLAFDQFWRWLQAHANCILRAGTPEAVLFDDDDLHWHFTREEQSLIVQVVRGKQVLGEILLHPADASYVEAHPGEGDEFLFEVISDTEAARVAAWFFVLSHGYDAAEAVKPGRWVH